MVVIIMKNLIIIGSYHLNIDVICLNYNETCINIIKKNFCV